MRAPPPCPWRAPPAMPRADGSAHDCQSEASPGALLSRLFPENVLLNKCQSARLDEVGQARPCRRAAFDPEFQWLAGGSGTHPGEPPLQLLRRQNPGGGVVE